MGTEDLPSIVRRMHDLTGRVVVITGAGQGIGRVYAKGLALSGAIPVIADLDGDKAAQVKQEVEALGGRALAVRTDVGDAASVAALAKQTVEAFGRVDGLINNAAVFSTLKMRSFDEIPIEEWERVLRVNVTGAMLCCKALLPAIKSAGRGRIINISSSAITMGRPNYAHYTTSKSGLIGFTRSAARELGAFGITVNAILPGATFTEVPRETVTPAQKEALVAAQCIKRPQAPEDLLGPVLFLLSDASAFITGQSITVDGGSTHL